MAAKSEQRARLKAVFEQLRRAAPGLGLRDLLDANSLIGSDWEKDEAAFQRAVRMLWCRSRMEEREFDRLWVAHSVKEDRPQLPNRLQSPPEPPADPVQPQMAGPTTGRSSVASFPTTQSLEVTATAILVKAPSALPLRAGTNELSAFWPI